MRNNLVFGIILITFGVFFLLDNLGMADFGELFHDYWPLLIVLWGFSILYRGQNKGEPIDPTIPTSDMIQGSTVFGRLYVPISSPSFKGGHLSTVFGDLIVDATAATIAEGEQHLRLNGVFGSVSVQVPAGTAVSVTTTSLFGSLQFFGQRRGGFGNNLTMASDGYQSAQKRLKITSSTVFGDVRIG